MSARLKGTRTDRVECRGGAVYSVKFSLEPVEPEVFWNFHQELTSDLGQDGLLYRFESSGRMALGAFSFIHLESRNRSLRIRAFHTFPDDYAIVKSESRFELP